MKLFRLTSVFFCCALLSSFLILPASAVDDDNFYSLPAVGSSEPSLAIEWPVNPVAGEYNSILGSISRQLGDISSQIVVVQKNQVTLAQLLSGISGIVTNNGKSLARIETTLSSFDSLLSAISEKVATESTLSAVSDKVATESSLAKLVGTFSTRIYDIGPTRVDFGQFLYSTFGPYSTLFSPNPGRNIGFNNLLSSLGYALTFDGTNLYEGDRTLYSRIRQLQEVLASDEDLAMREDQKENVDQVKKDFITGQSGKTSLGKDDFGSLSSVGGTFKDTISLNGQSSIGDLSSGLSDADTVGQGWFSQATKDSLDAVSGSGSSESTVSTFSDDGLTSVDVDPDPYHMQGFVDNYAWLWGDD